MRDPKEVKIDGVSLSHLLKDHMKKCTERLMYDETLDLSGLDLSYIDFSCLVLKNISFKGAYLNGCNFSHTLIKNSDFSYCRLCRSLVCYSSFTECDFTEADFNDSEISFSNFNNSKLIGTCFTSATITKSNMCTSKMANNIFWCAEVYMLSLPNDAKPKGLYVPLECPSEGSFIGWKKAYYPAKEQVIVKLQILEDSKRSSATSRKCRCDKALVLDIQSLDEVSHYDCAESSYDKTFIYKIGEIVSVDNFDDDRFNECAPGIHFFIDRELAVHY